MCFVMPVCIAGLHFIDVRRLQLLQTRTGRRETPVPCSLYVHLFFWFVIKRGTPQVRHPEPHMCIHGYISSISASLTLVMSSILVI